MKKATLYIKYETIQFGLEHYLGDLICERGDGYLVVSLKENNLFILGNILTYLYATNYCEDVEIVVDKKGIYNLGDVLKLKEENEN